LPTLKEELGLISPNFFARVFCTKFWRQKQQGWLLGLKFWRLKFCTKKRACKMLMELTPNFFGKAKSCRRLKNFRFNYTND